MGNPSENKETNQTKKNICLGILAHVDSGKTTLSESILYLCGSIRKLGRVDHGDAFLDNFELERSRGITIFSKQAVFDLGNTRFTPVSYTHLDVYKRQGIYGHCPEETAQPNKKSSRLLRRPKIP